MNTSMWIVMLAMLGGMALVMVGSVVVFHRTASEVIGGQPRGLQGALALLVNRVVTRLLRAGIPVRIFGNPVVLLTVPGRKTGQPRTTLVDLYERRGRRFLVSTHSEDRAHWVRNLRVAGKGGEKPAGVHRSGTACGDCRTGPQGTPGASSGLASGRLRAPPDPRGGA